MNNCTPGVISCPIRPKEDEERREGRTRIGVTTRAGAGPAHTYRTQPTRVHTRLRLSSHLAPPVCVYPLMPPD